MLLKKINLSINFEMPKTRMRINFQIPTIDGLIVRKHSASVIRVLHWNILNKPKPLHNICFQIQKRLVSVTLKTVPQEQRIAQTEGVHKTKSVCI